MLGGRPKSPQPGRGLPAGCLPWTLVLPFLDQQRGGGKESPPTQPGLPFTRDTRYDLEASWTFLC